MAKEKVNIINTLIAINDLDSQLSILENPYYKELGFELNEKKIEKLREIREKEIEKLPPEIRDEYEMLLRRYGKGVAPLIEGTCLNCFAILPTSLLTLEGKNLIRCPNCSVFLYKV
ncbi:MAG: hypothetical protein ABDH37_03210 [Candidatus Hydrothermales bacterium]